MADYPYDRPRARDMEGAIAQKQEQLAALLDKNPATSRILELMNR
jgi:hypothetical protein